MEVILMQDVSNLGGIGDQVKVKPGYARNYLLPQKMAVVASVKNQKVLEHQKRVASFELAKARVEDEKLMSKFKDMSLTIPRKVGDQDKLYGSVTAMDIQAALSQEGIELDRRKIDLAEPIKALGVYEVPIKLRADLKPELKVWVVAE